MERKLSITCENDGFEQVMEKVGFQGKYQSRFSFIFNFILVIFVSMPFLNIVLSLAVPDHWCYVPGRENTNYSLEEWKEITLPKELDIKGKESLSKCSMYNISFDEDRTVFENIEKKYNVVECQNGWEFDKTWYEETAPSQGSWVCEKELFVSNVFAFGRIGDVIGTSVFGQLGDIIGRKPVFYLTLTILLVGRILFAFSAHNYPLFLFSTLLGSLTSTAVFQAPLIIAMEISEESKRTNIAMMQCLGWTVGMCIMPFILWWMGHWFYFMLATTIPCSIFLFSFKWVVESPRWLASRGKLSKSIKELEFIAKVNGTFVPSDAAIILRKKTEDSEKVYGMLSLFSGWRIAKNTLLFITSWIVNALIYYVIVLNVSSIGGNPFMNFFWQAIAELPAYVLAKYVCDYIGRRWTQVSLNLLSACGLIGMSIFITEQGTENIIIALASFVKFCISFVFYGCNLQTLEYYPTCIRQTGLALGLISGSIFGIFGPYIVYLGAAFDARYPPLILTCFAITAATAASFLPETLHAKLPDTIAEANQFGKDQPFWSWPQKKIETAEKM